ncbi:MAG: hypothetical protein ABIT38_19530, partial [Gemmatimonadaceae bacterium]
PQGEFWIANYNSSMTFAPLPAAPQASAPYLTYRGKRADRVDAHGLRAPTSLAPFAGTYVSDELGIEYPIEVKGTTLVLRTRQQGDVTLTHRWRDDFSGEGFFRSVAFTRNSAGRVTGLLVNVDERSRDIRFARR